MLLYAALLLDISNYIHTFALWI